MTEIPPAPPSPLRAKRHRTNDQQDEGPIKKQPIIASSETQPSTAAQVFAIPELLEAILIAYGKQCHSSIPAIPSSNIPTHETIHPQTLAPVLELFPLQRVSRNFLITIQRSLPLRILMGLKRNSNYLSNLRWFLNELGMDIMLRLPPYHASLAFARLEQRDYQPHQPVERFAVFAQSGDMRDWELPSAWSLLPTASWRQMKIFDECPSGCLQEVQLDFDAGCFLNPRGQKSLARSQIMHYPNSVINCELDRQSLRHSLDLMIRVSREDDWTLGDIYHRLEEEVRSLLVEAEARARGKC